MGPWQKMHILNNMKPGETLNTAFIFGRSLFFSFFLLFLPPDNKRGEKFK